MCKPLMRCDRCRKQFEKWNYKHTEIVGICKLNYDFMDPDLDKQNLCEQCYFELETWWKGGNND